jgi:hypothetical protein
LRQLKTHLLVPSTYLRYRPPIRHSERSGTGTAVQTRTLSLYLDAIRTIHQRHDHRSVCRISSLPWPYDGDGLRCGGRLCRFRANHRLLAAGQNRQFFKEYFREGARARSAARKLKSRLCRSRATRAGGPLTHRRARWILPACSHSER